MEKQFSINNNTSIKWIELCKKLETNHNIKSNVILNWLEICLTFKINFLDVFHENQIKSKIWLIENLKKYILKTHKNNIFIFGGWYGILAYLIFKCDQITSKYIFNIDKDQRVKGPAYNFLENEKRYNHVVKDMCTYEYPFRPNVVINTSCEHLTNEQFIQWYNNIPESVIVVLQTNNYDKIPDHVGCFGSLEEFRDFVRGKLRVGSSYLYFCDKLQCSNFERYMAIFKKPTGVNL